MRGELTALTLVVLLQVLAIFIAGAQMNRELGAKTNAGPRDHMPEGSPLLGRLRRAVNNGFEGLALFAPLVLIVVITGKASDLTLWAAWIYLAARLAYIPAYAMGLAPWRSLIWGLGLAATLLIGFVALFAGPAVQGI
ncbi:MAPEG family protein [Pseudogemmobacter faecipullorum]|uniref:MAPEG family protein n=1 Tax=Pseudogemmobacter faecipullorum TaxID=2755041 RepID=A0ABS8CH03_9RHOB|nr:MAPEG family protein [Pseudogemmobacter faecipullorum]MCB5408678.1 MAPEG family protein [Pseudogemmobacter faecipullorum]